VTRFIAAMVSLACLSTSWAHAYEPAQRQAIKDFAYKDIGFGASVEDLERGLQVTLLNDESTPEKGHTVFAHLPNNGDVSAVFFSFIDDSLYEMRLVYDAPTANRIGGWNTIAERLVQKFGKADANSKGAEVEAPAIASFFWNFAEDNRFIELSVDKKYTRITFTDMAGWKRWEEKKKKSANVGF
jgi:hypothetical protein